jgi:hypothetical protein
MKRPSKKPRKPDSKAAKKTARSRREDGKGKSKPYRRLVDSPYGEEIVVRLRSGVSAEDVADWLQKECGAFLDVAASTLVRQLYRYRKTIPGALQPNKAYILEQATTQRAKAFNALQAAIGLAGLQEQRLGKALSIEQSGKTLTPLVGDEIDRMSRLIETVTEAKLRLGVLKQEAEGFGDSFSHARTMSILNMMDRKRPGSRAALVDIGKRMAAKLMHDNAVREALERLERKALESGPEIEGREADGNATT